MRIALFGTTSSTGQAVIDQALPAGHQVKALARLADKLVPRDGLTVLQGELRASNANYVVIQPVALTDKPASGKCTATLDGTLGGSEVSRHDLAAMILSELTAKTHTRQTISLSG